MALVYDSAFLDQLCAARRAHPVPLPLRALADDLVARALALLFPHFSPGHGALARDVTEEAAALEGALGTAVAGVLGDPARAESIVTAWMAALPSVREALLRDAAAIAEGDPAAEGLDEVILAYPG
ncbi:MAG: hypothetical protein MUE41_15800, partial [Gemmatimonadaceae bacterium]|nr:hypothetical protein [Gemmatimonadaceae bacterium]